MKKAFFSLEAIAATAALLAFLLLLLQAVHALQEKTHVSGETLADVQQTQDTCWQRAYQGEAFVYARLARPNSSVKNCPAVPLGAAWR